MSWTHLKDTIPTAKKDHICYLCRRIIPKGRKHIKRCGVDGEFISFRMHTECEEVTRDWTYEDWETADDRNEFEQEMRDYYRSI